MRKAQRAVSCRVASLDEPKKAGRCSRSHQWTVQIVPVININGIYQPSHGKRLLNLREKDLLTSWLPSLVEEGNTWARLAEG